MKKQIIILTMMLLLSVKAYALYDWNNYSGGRSIGFGGAYTSVSDDANAPSYNIAGIAGMDRAEITFMSAKIYSGLDGFDMSTDYLSFVYPLEKKYGSLALGWSYYGDTGVKREDIINIGYARSLFELVELTEIDWIEVLIGANFKYLWQEAKYEGSKLSQSALALDLGVLLRLKYGISVGYSCKYINTPDIGFRMEDKVERINTLGISYTTEELIFLKIPNFTISTDMEFRAGKEHFMIGAESIIDIKVGDLAVRAGGWTEQINMGIGYGMEIPVLKDKDGKSSYFVLDYTIGLPLEIEDSTGSHFLSITFVFP